MDYQSDDEDLSLQEKLEENMLRDHTKHDIPPKDRCTIIRSIMKRRDISQTKCAAMFGVPKTTFHYWVLWDKLSEDEVGSLKKKGYSDADINKMLRSDTKALIVERIRGSYIDIELGKILSQMKVFQRHTVDGCDHVTVEVLKEIVNVSNRLIIKIEKHKNSVRTLDI